MLLGGDYRVLLAEGASDALDLFDKKQVDLILLDLFMPGMTGGEFLDRLRERGETVPVIVVTASNSVETAVQVMKQGARDYVIKPFDVEELQLLVHRTIGELRQTRELSVLRELGAAGFEHIIGSAPALLEALGRARQAMKVDSTVLILGETGTGKDGLARAIHYGGRRADKPFVPLSCCAIPAALVESELFGHVRGAFTGATETRLGKMQAADGGTLFLDEIGEMPMDAQAKLLRVLQDGAFYPVGSTKQVEADVRFICATNRDFEKSIADGQFRQDLFYRINVLPIVLPPLRNRREDIPRLVAHFVEKHGPRVNSRVREFSPRAQARLMAYHWPGNIRELENMIERVLVCHNQEETITPEHLEGIVGPERLETVDFWENFEGMRLDEATQRLERRLIRDALERSNYVQSQAAELLGTTRRILKYKMDQLNICPEERNSPIA